MLELKGLKKPKGLKGLKGLGKAVKLPPIPDLQPDPQRVAGLVNDEVARLTGILGDERLARRVYKMKQKEYPQGTLPELVAIDWLQRRQIPFQFQLSVLGGRITRGGQVLDLVVDRGTHVIVIEINGNFFHTKPGKQRLDEGQKMALLSIKILGKRVQAIVEVWENKIQSAHSRNAVMNSALAGISLGP